MIVAPFLGEFGWLVAMWVPWLRHIRKDLHRGAPEFIVLCEPGQEFLFEDFATEVRALDLKVTVTRRDCQNAWLRDQGPVRAEHYVDIVQRICGRTPKSQIITPAALPVAWPKGECPRLKRAEHFRYVEHDDSTSWQIAMHVRHHAGKQEERNWPRENAEDVVATLSQSGYEVSAVGHPDHSICPLGPSDQRTDDVRVTCGVFAKSILVMGPSSGPLHLANYCDTPALWWSKNVKDVDRYGSHWNPFGLQNLRVKDSWRPSADDIIHALHLWMHP